MPMARSEVRARRVWVFIRGCRYQFTTPVAAATLGDLARDEQDESVPPGPELLLATPATEHELARSEAVQAAASCVPR
jgi:hypothetical protein